MSDRGAGTTHIVGCLCPVCKGQYPPDRGALSTRLRRPRRLRFYGRSTFRVGRFRATHWYGFDLGYWRFVVVWK